MFAQMEDIESQSKVIPETPASTAVGSLEKGAGGALNSVERGDEERGGGDYNPQRATKLGETDTYISQQNYLNSKKSYYTEDEEESKHSNKRTHFMLDHEYENREDYKSGDEIDIRDLEKGINPASHNINGRRKSRTLAH